MSLSPHAGQLKRATFVLAQPRNSPYRDASVQPLARSLVPFSRLECAFRGYPGGQRLFGSCPVADMSCLQVGREGRL